MSKLHFKTIYLSILCFGCTFAAPGQYINRLESANFDTDNTSIYIEDLKTGEVVLDLNGELSLMPASVMKIVTAASVLSSIDPSTKFKTRVTTQGKVANGVLDGDIIIHACGDPTVESAFSRLRQALLTV